MTTHDAFTQLVNSSYLWLLTGEPKRKRYWYINRLKYNLPIKLDKKEKLLEKAGYRVVVEKEWGNEQLIS